MRTLFVALVMVGVVLAGCIGDDGAGPDDDDDVVDRDEFQLQAGKGAIAGLLVDDRFRPIHLTDDPQTEFDATGFVLLQETGQQAQTTDNGEFTFVNLDPGTYTVRVTADGHEAVPQKVEVVEGVFNELSLVARRVTTASNTILTEEFSIFIPCAFVVPGVGLFTLNCVLDLSGDSFRSSFWMNQTALGDSISYLMAEVHVNQEGNWAMPLRDTSITDGTEEIYGRVDFPGQYGKVIIRQGPEPLEEGRDPWLNDHEMNIGLFYAGDIALPENDATGPFVGATTGVRGNFVISSFLGEPEVDLESYCVLCE